MTLFVCGERKGKTPAGVVTYLTRPCCPLHASASSNHQDMMTLQDMTKLLFQFTTPQVPIECHDKCAPAF